jgi:hypothetical protein
VIEGGAQHGFDCHVEIRRVVVDAIDPPERVAQALDFVGGLDQ